MDTLAPYQYTPQLGTYQHFPRETVERLGVPLTDLSTTPPTPVTDFDVCVVAEDQRPTGWEPAEPDLAGVPTVEIAGLAAGAYDVYVRVGALVRLFDKFVLD